MLHLSTNIMNHCGTHNCSYYYHKKLLEKYCIIKKRHTYLKVVDIITCDGIHYAKFKIVEYRMKLNKLQLFVSSRENNLTRGIRKNYLKIICD